MDILYIKVTGIVIILFFLVASCSNSSQQQLNNFEYEQDFETNKALFSKATFAINGHSTEGGEVLVFKAKKRDYKVYDVWFYNEMSKRNTVFYVNKSNKVNLVKQTTFMYDKPIYLEGATAKKMVQYFTYNKGDFKYFSNLKLEITDKELKTKKREELVQLFRTILQSTKDGLVKKKDE